MKSDDLAADLGNQHPFGDVSAPNEVACSRQCHDRKKCRKVKTDETDGTVRDDAHEVPHLTVKLPCDGILFQPLLPSEAASATSICVLDKILTQNHVSSK
jgi:hypothetical protein